MLAINCFSEACTMLRPCSLYFVYFFQRHTYLFISLVLEPENCYVIQAGILQSTSEYKNHDGYCRSTSWLLCLIFFFFSFLPTCQPPCFSLDGKSLYVCQSSYLLFCKKKMNDLSIGLVVLGLECFHHHMFCNLHSKQ